MEKRAPRHLVSRASVVLALVGVGACGSCSGASDPTPEATPDTTPADTSSSCEGAPFSEGFFRRVIETLAQPAWEGRRFDSHGLREATAWVRAQFECVGLRPGAASLPGLPGADFFHHFETDGDEVTPASDVIGYVYDPDRTYPFTNVIGSIPGTGALADEVVVLGAHIDHLGYSGVHDGALIVGANDDASGISALIAIAKQLASEPAPPSRRTLVFAAWGVEEDPFYLRGSSAFMAAIDAVNPATQGRIMSYLNFDMIGTYKDKGSVYLLGAFDAPEGTGFRASPGHRVARTLMSDYRDLDIALDFRGESSDHVTFCEAGIPYVFFWTEDDCYHSPCDEPSRIDYTHLLRIAELGADMAKALATDPALGSARAEFEDAFLAAFPGETCATAE